MPYLGFGAKCNLPHFATVANLAKLNKAGRVKLIQSEPHSGSRCGDEVSVDAE